MFKITKVKGVFYFSVSLDINLFKSMESDTKKIEKYEKLRSNEGIEGIDVILPTYDRINVKNIYKATSGDIIVILKDDIEDELVNIVCIWNSNAKFDEIINICLKKINNEILKKKAHIDSNINLQFYQSYKGKNKLETSSPIEYLGIEENHKEFTGRPKIAIASFVIGIIFGFLWYFSQNEKFKEVFLNVSVATLTYAASCIVEFIVFLIERKNKTYKIYMLMIPDYEESEEQPIFTTPQEE